MRVGGPGVCVGIGVGVGAGDTIRETTTVAAGVTDEGTRVAVGMSPQAVMNKIAPHIASIRENKDRISSTSSVS